MFILISEREREKLWNIVIIDRREKKEKRKRKQPGHLSWLKRKTISANDDGNPRVCHFVI